ncbi:anti-sigma regulatory factor [candidate division KSB1 bacterium]|nr:anti-sigma regulatory factor [candidate division KSB1 bacterium]
MTNIQRDKIDIPVTSFEEVILARQLVRELMERLGFSLLAQTRIVTAVSELARNMVVHAKDGRLTATKVTQGARVGVNCIFQDSGPGIEDIDQAMREGYSTTKSLGLGLGGAKKLCGEFNITSSMGKGTKIDITEWVK